MGRGGVRGEVYGGAGWCEGRGKWGRVGCSKWSVVSE